MRYLHTAHTLNPAKSAIRRYLEEAPLTPDEKAILEQDAEKIEQALSRLEVRARE